MKLRPIFRLILITLASFLQSGCRQSSVESISESAPTLSSADNDEPLRQLRTAVERGDWVRAETLGRAVLLSHHNEADALELVARAAHGNGRQGDAADLMTDACRVESFSNPTRIHEAIATLLAVGRLFDGMELLESAVQKHPEHRDFRRMLFEMYWGVEDRVKSHPHGQHLVRNRQFDVELLLAIGATESRTESAESFNEMVRRFNHDKRPLIAEARVQYDEGQTLLAIKILDEIVEQHPDHSPAVSLLAKALVDSDQLKRYAELAERAEEQTDNYPNSWIAKGVWCQNYKQFDRAARAYWEATLRDPTARVAWMNLCSALRQIDNPQTHGLTPEEVSAIDARLIQLTQLSQLKAEFIRSDKSSPALAIQIAEVLFQLGQAWEAEAWAAIATTLPGADQEPNVAAVRNNIVKSLRRDTPWQEKLSDPALRLDLSQLPQPDVKRVGSDSFRMEPAPPQPVRTSAKLGGSIRLFDESKSRSLVFAGHTSDKLDEPGIRHYQTLGCGGGTIDYDLDGWSDLYLAAAGGTPTAENSMSNSLWRNTEGIFQNVTTEAQVVDADFSQGVAVGDINEDGYPDLLVLNYGPNSLLINNGDGTFTQSNEMMNDQEPVDEWSSSAAIADIDLDGLADVVIVNYGSGMEPITKECRHATTQVSRACSPLVFAGVRDRFLFNDGVKLVDRTDQCGSPPVVGRGLGVLVSDFGDNAGLGILISNDLTSNHFWSRSSEAIWLLEESAIPRGLGSDDRAPAQGSMGIAGGDFDNDGDLDAYVTNFQSEANTYHEQVSRGLWRDRTVSLNLDLPTRPMVGFGSQAVDFDNDGTLELIVANGHVDDYPTESSSPYAQPMQLFRREKEGPYVSIMDDPNGNYLSKLHVGRALWTIDANRDRRTDTAVTHQTEPMALLMNNSESQGTAIELKLVGRVCSRDAIGTKVTIKTPSEGRVLTAFQSAGDGYLCSNEHALRIGLGDASRAARVEVRWPNGQVDSFENLTANRCWLIVQGDRQAFELAN